MTSRSRATRRGFTLVEVMTVVFIMSALMSIAMLGFQRARYTAQRHCCRDNLRQIQAAKEQWANETRSAPTATPTWSDLVGPLNYLRFHPECPADGEYELNALSNEPTCSYADTDPTHSLPP